MMEAALDHLWQSTLFAALAGLLVLTLRNNSPRIRFWLWFAASMKFLVPFAFLAMLGTYLPAPALFSPPALVVSAGRPFTAVAGPVAAYAAPAPHLDMTMLLLLLWAAGSMVILARWLVRWLRLQRVLRGAVDFPLAAPVPVKEAPSSLEPGLIGIWRPVILLPQGIAARLSGAEMCAIIAHEVCHLRRRDNLLAALHMLVEALFWFHPLVWWLGIRLNAERENACDEAVLAAGTPPQVYVDGILKVCQFYLNSPLACAAGVSGADLKRRVGTIMANKRAARLGRAKKFLLAFCAAAAFAAPLALGVLQSPRAAAQGSGNASAMPGTEAALRRQIAGWEKRQPAFQDMTPGWAQATRESQAATQKMFEGWGPLKSLTFKGRDRGDDVFLATFQHGASIWAVFPLEQGKISYLTIQEAIARSGNGPSPGVAAALRRHYEALRKEDYNLMMPRLANRTRGGIATQIQDAKKLGALKSLTFARITPRGLDLYAAVFDNGTATFEAEPLKGNMPNDLLWSNILLPRAPQHPGTDVVLRRHIEALQKDRPNFQDMAPQLAALQRQAFKGFQDEIRPWGALRAIKFLGGGSRGWDRYEVRFEHARVQWYVAPLSPDGKMMDLSCGEITLLAPGQA